MSAGEFKAKCLKVMDEVAATGKPVIVTKRGRPVVQLAPVVTKPKTLRGFLKGRVVTRGDIIAPVDVAWDVERS
jgi:prevent-host-death family protein